MNATAAARKSVCFIASSPPVGMPRPPSGPATDVVEMAYSPPTTAQQAHGAAPICWRTFQLGGAVPVCSATCAMASAMPAAKQLANVGIQSGWT
jgi:hypothetical protein